MAKKEIDWKIIGIGALTGFVMMIFAALLMGGSGAIVLGIVAGGAATGYLTKAGNRHEGARNGMLAGIAAMVVMTLLIFHSGVVQIITSVIFGILIGAPLGILGGVLGTWIYGARILHPKMRSVRKPGRAKHVKHK